MQSVGRMLMVAVGLGVILLGGLIIVTPLAYATMIDEQMTGGAWWGEYWSNLVREIPLMLLGLGIEGIGWALIFYNPDRPQPRRHPPTPQDRRPLKTGRDWC